MHIRSAATRATMTSLALLARQSAGFRVGVSSRVRVRVTSSSARPPPPSPSSCSSTMQQQMSTSSTGTSSGTAAGAATQGQQPRDHGFDFETPIDRSDTGEGSGVSPGGGLTHACPSGGSCLHSRLACGCQPPARIGAKTPDIPEHASGKSPQALSSGIHTAAGM